MSESQHLDLRELYVIISYDDSIICYQVVSCDHRLLWLSYVVIACCDHRILWSSYVSSMLWSSYAVIIVCCDHRMLWSYVVIIVSCDLRMYHQCCDHRMYHRMFSNCMLSQRVCCQITSCYIVNVFEIYHSLKRIFDLNNYRV